jgi:hypothetical protein
MLKPALVPLRGTMKMKMTEKMEKRKRTWRMERTK